MTVNTDKRVTLLFALFLSCSLFTGCFSKGKAPYVSFMSASSRLSSDGTSNRVDVIVDLRNGRYEAFKDLSLTVSFANGSEALFKWPELKPYGYAGAEEAMEVIDDISKAQMLGGTFETLLDDRDGALYTYATEVSGALFTYKDASGSVYKKDIGREVSAVIMKSFQKITSEDLTRNKDRRKRLDKLKKTSKQ